MWSPIGTAIFVGGASLLHLRPKFSVTGTIYVQDYQFGNLALLFISLKVLLNVEMQNLEKKVFNVKVQGTFVIRLMMQNIAPLTFFRLGLNEFFYNFFSGVSLNRPSLKWPKLCRKSPRPLSRCNSTKNFYKNSFNPSLASIVALSL